MYSVRLEIDEKIYDKVMFFLENISRKDLTIKEIKPKNRANDKDLVGFLRKSPLASEIQFLRDGEIYKNRVGF